MENAARALEMAAGVLLGVLLMAAVSYFFSNIGELPTQQDELTQQEQLADFNKGYEAFNKSGMYGVDVLSCLNKAKSNNEKYVAGNRFLSGVSYGQKYMVEVYVNIKEALKESIDLYYYHSEDKLLVQHWPDFLNDDGYPGKGNALSSDKETVESIGLMTAADYEKKKDYTKLELGMDIMEAIDMLKKDPELEDSGIHLLANSSDGTAIIPTAGLPKKNYYSLLEDEQLDNLLNYADTMRVVKYNIGKNKHVWNSVVWTTALYDFKTKKFKCDHMEYHPETGRVNVIYFSEI